MEKSGRSIRTRGIFSLTKLVDYQREGDLAIVTIDNPPVNATSTAVRTGLLHAIRSAEADQCNKGLIRCAGRTFVAGGDVSEFGKPPQEPHLPDICIALQHSPTIWVAVLFGTVLGGGFELAMACDYRIADKGARFGLPEVNLGLVPGAGGTQFLPRLVGVELAADLASSGRLIAAQSLFEAGGLDRVIDGDVDAQARIFLEGVNSKSIPVSQRSVASFEDGFFDAKREAIKKSAKGAAAPNLNLDAVEWATKLSFDEGQPRERALHLKLRYSDQSIALRHVFFSERAAAHPTAITGTSSSPLDTIAVVGGGLMGAGIASACLNAGFKVRLIERDIGAADAGRARVETILQGALKRGKINATVFDKQRAALMVGDDYAASYEADVAIEAVFEDLAVKQSVFRSLAQHMRNDAIIATNTSYLDPREIADSIANPDRVVGLHFFSPAHIMKLLEIVRLPQTSKAVLATSFELAKRLRKTSVLSGICDGFIGNRMLAAYRRQADYMLADGALPKEIDGAMRAFGMPMGPYELQDLTGLQIAWANRKRQAATRDPKERYVAIADQLCELERLGQRTGKGWYRYEDGNRSPVPDETVQVLINAYSAEHGITRRTFEDTEIQSRLIAVLANEGARIVEEGIAERDLDVDVVKIHGYGFPRWRGGPMHHAEALGVKKVRDQMRLVREQSPGSWALAERYQVPQKVR